MSENGAVSFKIIRPHRVANRFHAVLIVTIINILSCSSYY